MPTRNPAGLLGVALGLLCATPAALWLVFLGLRIVRQRRLRNRMRAARGVVVGHEVLRDTEGDLYRPRVRFTTETNLAVEFVSGLATMRKDALGSAVTVLYDPEQPAGAQIDRWMEQWLLPTIGLAIGVFALMSGLLYLGVSLAVWYFNIPTPAADPS